jgi:hypothetical protein
MELFDCGFGIADCGIINLMIAEFSFFQSEIRNLKSEIS